MRMWTGQTISLLGSQVTLLALPLTAILLFHASPFQVGTLSTVEFLPFVLLGRMMQRVRQKRCRMGKFAQAVPLLLPALTVYVAGECIGYLTGPGDALSKVE